MIADRQRSSLGQIAFLCLLSTIVFRFLAARIPGPIGGPDVCAALLTVFFALLSTFLKRRPVVSSALVIALATTFALIAWTAIVYTMYGELAAKMSRVGSMILGAGLIFAVYTTVDTVNRIRTVMVAFIIAVTVSAIVGIGIAMGYEAFWDLWVTLNVPSDKTMKDVIGGRTAGHSVTVITFSYTLCVAIPFAFALFVSRQWSPSIRLSKSRIFLIIVLIILCNALVLNETRSAMLGVICGAALILGFKRLREVFLRPLRALVILALISLTVMVLSERHEVFKLKPRVTNLSDMSSSVRLPMARAAIRYGIENPLGTGSYKLNSKYLDKELSPRSVEHILSHTPHNQFLVVLVYYGFPGLFLLLIFYFIVAHSLYRTRRVGIRISDSESLVLIAAASGAVCAYVINSLAHNAGPFVGDWSNFILIGLVFSIRRVVSRRVRSQSNYVQIPTPA